MAAKQVTVSYNPSTSSLTYSPSNGNVEMDESGTITFSKPPQVTYTGFSVTPASEDFSWTTDANGDLVVTDDDADAGTYEYTITYTVGARSYTSDPQIINKTD